MSEEAELLEISKRRIAAFLSHEGFVFSVNQKFLKRVLGNICETTHWDSATQREWKTKIHELMIGLSPQNFYIQKFIVIFIEGRSKKELLRVFSQTLFEKVNLEPSAHFLVIPIDDFKVKRMDRELTQLQFLDYCQNQGIRIYTPELFQEEELAPILLQDQKNEESLPIDLLKLALNSFTRESYLQVLGILSRLFGLKSFSYRNENKLIALAIAINSMCSVYDYGRALDVEERFSPFHIFGKELNLSLIEIKKAGRDLLHHLMYGTSDPLPDENQLSQKLVSGVLQIAKNHWGHTINFETFLKKRGIKI